MADNQGEHRQAPMSKNIHNFSWFPSILLLFQLFLLLFGLFKFNHEIVNSFKQFLKESSLLLSMINGLLILWYWIKGTILKRTDISKEFKIINSCICFFNIVLLNDLYKNDKIKMAFNSINKFFASENIAVYVFALVVIAAVFFIVRYAKKTVKNAPPDEIQPGNSVKNSTATDIAQQFASPNVSTVTDIAQPQQMSTSTMQGPPRNKDTMPNVLFAIIFLVLLLLIAAVVYLLIAKYDMIDNIINNKDSSSKILTYLFLAISAIILIILSIIIVAATARSISKLIFQIPEYIRKAEIPDDRITKVAIGIVLIPVFYGIANQFGINIDKLLESLQDKNFLVIPFIILLYFVLSMLFVEVLYGLFSGEPKTKWLKGFTKIISATGKSVIKICDSIVKSFFRLLKFIPDFLEAIETVLMGEEDEEEDEDEEEGDNAQLKQNGQNGKGGKNKGKG